MAKSSADDRRSNRSPVVLIATLKCRDATWRVRVANLSANGALVFGKDLPGDDNEVTLCFGEIAVGGWIAWGGSSHAGINFESAIKLTEVLRKRSTTADFIVKDSRDGDFRRPGFRGDQLTDAEREVLAEWKREQNGK